MLKKCMVSVVLVLCALLVTSTLGAANSVDPPESDWYIYGHVEDKVEFGAKMGMPGG